MYHRCMYTSNTNLLLTLTLLTSLKRHKRRHRLKPHLSDISTSFLAEKHPTKNRDFSKSKPHKEPKKAIQFSKNTHKRTWVVSLPSGRLLSTKQGISATRKGLTASMQNAITKGKRIAILRMIPVRFPLHFLYLLRHISRNLSQPPLFSFLLL